MNEEKNNNDLNDRSKETEPVDEIRMTKNSQQESDQNQENDKNQENKVESEEDPQDQKDQDMEQTLKAELDETKDKLLRVLAENENVRKQAEKTKIDSLRYGVQPLARELINVVDNFERAIDSFKSATEDKTIEGFELIKKEIEQILEKFSIKKIGALGETFDANLHQAMFEKPTSDFENGTVCEIVQDGYTFHDRLLRPAMVGIAKNEDKIKEGKKNYEQETEMNLKKNDSD